MMKRRLEIWLIREGEPLPENSQRLKRTAAMAKYFSEQGHQVTWFSSTYLHDLKTYICKGQKEIALAENEKLVLLHSPVSYKRNMSPLRYVYISILGKKFEKCIKNMDEFPTPDIIFCSYPTEQFCRAALHYGELHQIPVILDARDQWPDIFERALPHFLRTMGNFLLAPLKKRTSAVFQKADAICAVSPTMLDWAMRYAGRAKTPFDRSVFIGSERKVYSRQEIDDAIGEWSRIGISETTWNVCAFTGLSRTAIDLDTVIDAVEILHQTHPQIRFIIGGKGDEEARLRKRTKGLSFVYMMGWLGEIQMDSLMSISRAGMLCYRNTRDFKDGWGNKVGQYLSYGLPLLTSARGYAKYYVEKYECGYAYEENHAKSLSDLLQFLMEDPEEWARVSKNAADRFHADFDQKVVMKKFENMLYEVWDAHGQA